MTVTKLFNRPTVLYQTVDDDMSVPEAAISGCLDASGLVCLSQEGRDIIVNRASVPELCKMLRTLAAEDHK
jgi:hypothetical protein